MDLLLLSVIAVIAMALVFDFTNGFHDAANSISTVVATRAMPAKFAPWFAAFFNFVAYFVVGTAVANTVAKIVNESSIGVAVVFSALVGAILWNYATWWLGMPSSSSHAIIGGLVGAGLAAGGLDAIDWGKVEKTGIAILASPLVAFSIAFLAIYLVGAVQKLTGWGDDHKVFKGLQVVGAAGVSFGHGANDAQKTMGIIAAVLVAAGYVTVGDAASAIPVPEWVALASYSAIAIGTIWGGWRIIETMGLKITTLHAHSGVAANIGSITSIFGATSLGIPISTTHAAASSIMGAGVGSGKGANLKIIGEMMLAWLITIPSTLVLAWFMFKLTQLPTAAAWISVGSVMFVAGGAVIYAMAHATTAADVEAEIPPEEELAKHEPIHPHIEGHGPVE